MTDAGEEKSSEETNEEARRDWRAIILDWIKLPLIVLLAWATDGFKNLLTQPGHALWVFIPLAVLSVSLLNPQSKEYFRLPWHRIGILAAYTLVFFAIVETGLLDWKRPLVGFENSVPRNFLNLDRFGDWLYLVAPETRNSDFAVVLKKHPPSIEERRLQIADLIELASESDAKGIALDFYFVDEASGIDEYLCNTITEAKIDSNARQMPIFVGYDFEITNKGINRLPGNPLLDKCLLESSRGHAIGYQARDGVIRSIPLYRENNPRYPALSMKAATQIAGEKTASVENGLLEFVKPKNDFELLQFEKLWSDYKGNPKEWEEDQKALRDKLVLVGEESDEFKTPYGTKPGAVVHAYAAHSLTQNHFIKRYRWWTSLAIIFVLGYLLMVEEFQHRGKVKRLLRINVAFSFFIVLFAILSMSLWLNWIEVAHPLLAIWLLLVPLMLVTKIRPKQKPQPPDVDPNAAPSFPGNTSQPN